MLIPTVIVMVAIFVAITAGVWAVLTLLVRDETRVEERLQELREPQRRHRDEEHPAKESGVGSAFRRAAPALSKALQPTTELEESKLKVRLANAGFNGPTAATLFLATKMAAMAAGAVLGGGIGVFLEGLSMNGLIALIGGGGIGMFVPEIVLTLLVWKRKEKIFLSMPDALDLLVVCVESGLGLDAAMRRVSAELFDGAPDICNELNLCNMQLQMGRPRREVLHDLGVRTDVDDVKALSAILIQADKFGSSIAQALRVQSDSMRVKRSQLAEERAQKTAVQMIFPLVLFIFPGIFVVLVGPAAIMMIRNLLNT